ncbi:MAG: hypothetical protein UX06_C0001G0010 [Candidatus Giovannonibacteria bacterium GW2011_GWA2_45_21]|uniref:Uncharacterized protein n=1 Tax=Candidatus Giovannonibacteria bacterium GW2011_GWA2_45_21 TaxID=1618649 RepID=A0A0G1MAD4_9BACT|nr:MAG: hypothetical protein UX06_C0001G0010 [Candidatus Giovannonibacteria bacterium GW2011_GWA2_45_21]
MMLTKEEIEAFKALYSEQYGVELTDAQVLDKGPRLVRLLKVVLKAKYENDKQNPNTQG